MPEDIMPALSPLDRGAEKETKFGKSRFILDDKIEKGG
jgi:hypothetical protein